MYRSVFTLLMCALLVSGNIICDNQTYVYKLPGNVTIAALIGVHNGEGCSEVRNQALQLIQSLISAIEAIRINNIIPGINIGLTIYDTCSQEEMAQKSVISALIEAECSNSFILGAVMEEDTVGQVRNITTNVDLFTFRLTTGISERVMSSMAVGTLSDLHWAPVDKVYTQGNRMAVEFMNEASLFKICVKNQLNLTELKKMVPSDTAVIFTDTSNFSEQLNDPNRQPFAERLLIVPSDGEYQLQADTKLLKSKPLIILPTTVEKPVLINPFNITERLDQDLNSDVTRSQVSLEQLQTMSDVIKLVGILKAHIKLHCPEDGGWKLCQQLPKLHHRVERNSQIDSIGSIKYHLKLLRTDPEDFEAAVLVDMASSQKIGSIRISGQDWNLDAEVNVTEEIKLCKPKPLNETQGYDCSECSNYDLLYRGFLNERSSFLSVIHLKQEAWVAALVSISTVGILCCIAITVFILVRICKKDMLEGNPGFSFLLLFSVIFMYLSILPFSFKPENDDGYYSGVFCGLKLFGTSLSYGLVFSIMLARSVMLASCDEDGGFMSHVNGYLQTIMFFFIAAVQVALTIQFWAINWLLLSEEQCAEMSRGSLFLFLLAYDMLLLLTLLIISPFIMRSKRNYHEGGYFSVSALLCLTVWLAWCAGYVFFPSWDEVFICCGLVATASVILVTVFIPRTYLMLTGIVRDHIVSTLPTLGHTTSTSVIDVNYRSTQALYDSVTIPRGNGNPNYYSDRPTTPSTSKMDEDAMHDNNYERYESSPTPHNITRF